MGVARQRRLNSVPRTPAELSEPQPFTLEVSDRSMRRVQVSLAGLNAAQQALQAVQGVAAGAKNSLDEAMGSLADAAGMDLPAEYNLRLDLKAQTITVSPIRRDAAGRVIDADPVKGDSEDVPEAAMRPSAAPGA
jgi:hypothetical protein